MNFNVSFCDPLKKDIINYGNISHDHIVDKFLSISWTEYLEKMRNASRNDIYYSPSISFQNSDTKHGLEISAVGEPETYEFFIFYKRPKLVKKFFGLTTKYDENYVTHKTGGTDSEVIDCLKALARNDTEYLVDRIGY